MSYNKMMKWNKKRPKGTRQPVIMHTGSGFWPSISFLNKYFAYREQAEKSGLIPVECEIYYHLSTEERRKLIF